MLSELLRFEITDKRQNCAKLADLSAALVDEDYPPVKQLFFLNGENKFMRLEWNAVESLDIKNQKIKVADLDVAEEIEPESVKGDVLLQYDVLDALILDLLNRSTTRASDLQLEETGGQLRLRAVDAGFGAMLRRISHGFYKRISRKVE